MQQMAELMEDRFHLSVIEQSRATRAARRQVSAHQPEMRQSPAGTGTSGDEVIHPRSAALRLPRMPVGVERSEMTSIGAMQVVQSHLRMPDNSRVRRPFGDPQAEQP